MNTPTDDIWRMRKCWLPELPKVEGWYTSTWLGEHPSSRFKGINVWWTGYYPELGTLLEVVYGDALRAFFIKEYSVQEVVK